ncbi:MAG: ATP-binding protein [Cytophagales bacterium]|nr:ATP-binding protein [Cytophagales bacterium]
MVFNRFFFKLLFRLALITASIVTLSTIFLRVDLFFTQIILVGIIIAQLVELTYFVNRTNLELSRFLSGVRDGDFQLSFSQKADSSSFKALNHSFREVIHAFREYETERMAEYQFLNEIISQISFGVIVFDDQEEIQVMNQTASDLLSLPKVTKWKNLRNPNIAFVEQLYQMELAPNQLIETRVSGKDQMFSVTASQITLRSVVMKIVCFQNIQNEIRKKEIEAWHKLIRILTHETMNSVTPIVSLAETMQMILHTEEGHPKSTQEISDENLEDLAFSLETIIGRGNGILKFVNNYRKLTRIPKPEIEPVTIAPWIRKIINLTSAEPNTPGIHLDIADESVIIPLDPVLIEQVLINLLKNSKEALENSENPTITVKVKSEAGNTLIIVQDNGPGVDQEKIEKIFIPFYTTKKEGSGIGLSVSRQIMSLHGGHLELQSEPGSTIFTLSFQN